MRYLHLTNLEISFISKAMIAKPHNVTHVTTYNNINVIMYQCISCAQNCAIVIAHSFQIIQ